MEKSCVLKIPKKEFTVIDFPFIIKNEEKALRSLGGLDTIIEKLKRNMYQTTKRISVCVKPNNIYAKPLIGECVKRSGAIIKFRQLRNKKTGEIKVVPEALGRVHNVYEFNIPFDYQFSPHEDVTDIKTCKVFYDQIVPNKLFKNVQEFEEYIYSKAPMFLPPVVFTKNERPGELKLFNLPTEKVFNPDLHENENDVKIEVTDNYIKIVEKLFTEKPMWTANHMKHVIVDKGITFNKFSKIRNEVGSYISTGPWKRTWVSKNYDYKSDPESRKFQVVEFRGNPSHIDFLKKSICNSEFRVKSEFVIKRNNWLINETNLPTKINIFYPLCNIEIPEVIDFLKNEPFPQESHEKFGWFTSDIENKVRQLIQNFVSIQVELMKKNLLD